MRLAGNIIDTMLNATGLAHKRMIEVMTGKRTDAVIREELPLIEDISQHPLHLLARRNRQEPMSVEAFPVVVLAVADPISEIRAITEKPFHPLAEAGKLFDHFIFENFPRKQRNDPHNGADFESPTDAVRVQQVVVEAVFFVPQA